MNSPSPKLKFASSPGTPSPRTERSNPPALNLPALGMAAALLAACSTEVTIEPTPTTSSSTTSASESTGTGGSGGSGGQGGAGGLGEGGGGAPSAPLFTIGYNGSATSAKIGEVGVDGLNLHLKSNAPYDLTMGFEVSLVIENQPTAGGGLINTSTTPPTPNYTYVVAQDGTTIFTFPGELSTDSGASDTMQTLDLGEAGVYFSPGAEHNVRITLNVADNAYMIKDRIYLILKWPFEVRRADTKELVDPGMVTPHQAIFGDVIGITGQ